MHRGTARRNTDFRITHRRRITTVHTRRERPLVRRMRLVQAAQPFKFSNGSTPLRLSKGCAAHALRLRLIEAGRNPLLGFPLMVAARQTLQIPTPFDNFMLRRQYTDQPKRIDLRKGQTFQRSRHRRGRVERTDRGDDHTATGWIRLYTGGYGIPVDQGIAHTVIVQRNPGSPGRLGWTKYASTIDEPGPGRKSGDPAQSLVAIH